MDGRLGRANATFVARGGRGCQMRSGRGVHLAVDGGFAGRKGRWFPTAGNGASKSADPFGLGRRDAPPSERCVRARVATGEQRV